MDQQDGDKTNILIQVFWICLAVLESDFEHEFLLGLRLLDRVLDRLPLDRPDVREKVEKLHVQVLHALWFISVWFKRFFLPSTGFLEKTRVTSTGSE